MRIRKNKQQMSSKRPNNYHRRPPCFKGAVASRVASRMTPVSLTPLRHCVELKTNSSMCSLDSMNRNFLCVRHLMCPRGHGVKLLRSVRPEPSFQLYQYLNRGY